MALPLRGSLRGRILILVAVMGLLPPLLVGWWIAGTAARSGETLLRTRLREGLDATAAEVVRHWVPHRTALLDLGDAPAVQRWLLSSAADPPDREGPPAEASGLASGDAAAVLAVRQTLARTGAAVRRIVLRTPDGRTLGPIEGDDAVAGGGAPFATALLVHERASSRVLGTLEADVDLSALLPDPPLRPSLQSAILAALERGSGAAVLPGPFQADLLQGRSFTLLSEQWLSERRALADPEIELVAAAPLTPFTHPFQQASRRGLWALLAAAAAGLVGAALLTARMTRSLGRLSAAAEGIARGDLDRRVRDDSPDEIGRLSRAFDDMAESLRRTLRELSESRSVAAVGEFASELAHEVRNPLTALKMDLQVVEERLPDGSPLRPVQLKALEEVQRLERTVSGALLLARSGRVEKVPVDLWAALDAAIHAARPIIEREGARLLLVRGSEKEASESSSAAEGSARGGRQGVAEPLTVIGDAGALQQMFLNLLVNAGQAVGPAGTVRVVVASGGASAVVRIEDDGRGIAPGDLERVREPFFSTRLDGTGLGLGIADRIARAHGGSLGLSSEPGVGTIVEVRVPGAGGGTQ